MTEKKKNQKKNSEPYSLPIDEKANNAVLQESKEGILMITTTLEEKPSDSEYTIVQYNCVCGHDTKIRPQ